tara:strand:- start:1434 stop:2183 length:750 start_codon:yes stop_codon:yes gene_type:complete
MIVYTVITTPDCPIPEQHHIDPSMEYVMVHTFDLDVPKPWKSFKIKEEVSPRYTFAKYQMLSHILFQEDCAWFDGKQYILPGFYTQMLKDLEGYDCVIPMEHQRRLLLDELVDWYLLPCIDQEGVKNVLNFLNNLNYDFTQLASCNNCAYIRKYNKNTIEHNNKWFEIWCKYKTRTQLPWLISSWLLKYNANYVKYYPCIPRAGHQNFEWNGDIKKRRKQLPKIVKLIKKLTNTKYILNNANVSFRIDV